MTAEPSAGLSLAGLVVGVTFGIRILASVRPGTLVDSRDRR